MRHYLPMNIRAHAIAIAVFVIVSLSLLMLYSEIYPKHAFDTSSVFFRQLVWAVLGWIVFIIFSRIPFRGLLAVIYPFYVVIIVLLSFVLAAGAARLGAQRWIKIWWFNFQPSEFAKIAIILVLSHYYSRKAVNQIRLNIGSLSFLRGIVYPFLIILVPFGLIVKQPDLGTALLLMFIFLGMAYYSGVKMRYILLILVVGSALSPFLWHCLRDYQKDRILVFLNPNSDPLGAGYTIIQSKIAIGSGRIFGKGWLSGTQGQLNFLPESHTDFIFGIFSEETGFLGSLFLLGLYGVLIFESFRIAQKANDNFGKLFAFGIGLMLAIQVYINISMTLGISPVVGVPLPLMSYGGSNMLVNFLCLGIVQNINARG